MTPEAKNFCLAIITYLGFGDSVSPRNDRDRVIEIFGHDLLEKVLLVLGEVNCLEVDWSHDLTLKAAGMLVRREMQLRYPELNDLALDAIAWKYTFDWR